MTNRKKGLIYLKALEVATIENEIELTNILIDKIIECIIFLNTEEKENYLNYIQGFKNWYDFKAKTMYLLERKIKLI